MASKMNIGAIKISQGDKTLYMCSVPARILIRDDFLKVDAFHPSQSPDKKGYQRPISKSRPKQFARYLAGLGMAKKPLIPSAMVLNSRGRELKFVANGNNTGTLTVTDQDLPLYLVDGQHRQAGFLEAIKNGGLPVEDMELPCVVMDNCSRYEEMLHFYLINQEQKRIRTDLAWELLRQRKEKEGGVIRIRDREDWKTTAVVLTEEINKLEDSVWGAAIQLPSEERRMGIHLQKSISFEQSLKPILQSDLVVIPADIDKLAELLCHYWDAWKELAPESFQDPDNHVIQKTPGIFSLHKIFPTVIEIASHVGTKPLDKKAFLKVLKPLEGEYDAQYWRKDEDGAAQFGSMKGFAQLAERLESALKESWEDKLMNN